ncbi:MAG: ABC transporter ATP-binding protein [Deltaproteobacteria bacterium]|nr:ABC transporter ATP-binding protein [Deltaproteobacteria bacterium]
MRLLQISLSVMVLPLGFAIAAAACEGLLFTVLIPLLEEAIRSASTLLTPDPTLSSGSFNPSRVPELLAGLLLLSLIKLFFHYISSVSLLSIIRKGADNLRKSVFFNFLGASKTFFDRNHSGVLYQALLGYTQDISLTLNSLHQAFFRCCLICSYLLVLVYTRWQLVIVLLLAFPLLYLLVNKLVKRIKFLSRLYAQHQAKLSSTVADLLHNIILVKTTATESKQRNLFKYLSGNLCSFQFRIDKLRCLLPIAQELIVIILLTIGILAVYYFIPLENVQQVAGLLVFLIVTRRIMGNIGFIGEIRGALAQIYGPISQLENIIQQSQMFSIPQGQKQFEYINHELNIRDLSFSYPQSPAVLENFNCTIAKGYKCALFGVNGAGKTTFINLLLRLYKPTSGSILVDDVPIEEFSLDSWYRKVALVSQDVLLFNDTLGANLNYGLETNASEQELKEALSEVGLDYLCTTRKLGLDSLIGEAGTILSGGERQRLSLARALLRKSELIIFDEPTSHLNEEAARDICKLLTTKLEGRTVLVVTHDRNIANFVDTVVKMEKL